MNIAVVSSGNSIHVKKIINALVNKGFNITLYTLRNHNKLLNDFDNRIKVVKLPFAGPIGYILNAPILRKKVLKGNYDLINSHYASGYGTLVRLARLHPLSLAVFGSDIFEYPFKSKRNMKIIKKNLDNADIITSTSEVMKKKILSFYDTKKNIYVTPFGVDLKLFHKKERTNNDENFRFGIIKKIEYIYGHDILIKAFKKFTEKYPDAKVKLEIYGRGSYIKSLKQLVEHNDLDDKVIFNGFVKNELVPDILSNLDVVCLSSRVDESFGVSAIEAMACGIPIIATDAVGFTEVIEEGKTGIIVRKESVEEFANAMIKLYEMSIEERQNIGKNGSMRAKALYSFDDNIQTYINALMHYKEL